MKRLFCFLFTVLSWGFPHLTDAGCCRRKQGIHDNDEWLWHTIVEDNRWPDRSFYLPSIHFSFFNTSLKSFLCSWDVKYVLSVEQDMLTADCPVQLLTFQTGCTYHALWGCPFVTQQMLPVRSSPILSPPWLFSYFCTSAKGTAGEDDIHVIVHNEGSFVSGLFAHYLLCLQLLQLLSSGESSQRRFCAPCHLSALKHDTKNIRQDMISGLTRRQLTLCFVNQNTLGLITSFCSLQW